MNNDLGQALQLSNRLEAGLIALSKVWDTNTDDPRIKEVRNSAQINFLARVNLSLTRLRGGQDYEELQPFFKGLASPTYTPKLHGLNIKTNTTEYAQAIKFLKDLAYSIGHDIDREYGFVKRLTDPAWIKTGLVPASNIITVVEPDDDIGDWGRDTVPRPLVIDETDHYKDEIHSLGQIVANANLMDLAKYLKEKLKPRQAQISDEVANRRQNYPTETAFRIVEGSILDFQDYLNSIITIAESRINALPILNISPETQEPAKAPQIDSVALTAKLSKIAAYIQGEIETSHGKTLEKLYKDTIKPKFLSVKAEVEALQKSDSNQEQLLWKEKHLAVLKDAASAALTKIRIENDARLAAKEAAPAALAITLATLPSNHSQNQTAADAAPQRSLGKDSIMDVPYTEIAAGPRRIAQKATTRVIDLNKDKPPASSIFGDSEFETIAKPRGLKGFLQKSWVRATGAVAAVCLAVGFSGAVKELPTPVNVAPVPAHAQAEDLNTIIGKAAVAAEEAARAAKAAPVSVPAPANEPAVSETRTIIAEQAPAPTVSRAPVAKHAFKPAAEKRVANDQTISSEPITMKPFDIATFRPDLKSLKNACDFAGVTGANTVCGSLTPQVN